LRSAGGQRHPRKDAPNRGPDGSDSRDPAPAPPAVACTQPCSPYLYGYESGGLRRRTRL